MNTATHTHSQRYWKIRKRIRSNADGVYKEESTKQAVRMVAIGKSTKVDEEIAIVTDAACSAWGQCGISIYVINNNDEQIVAEQITSLLV
jgi:hypothetical protein